MLDLRQPLPVKVFAAVLYREESAWEAALPRLAGLWGSAKCAPLAVPFDLTDYYEPEMGPGLGRRFVSFANLVCPDQLSRLKREANEVEAASCRDGQRTVNVDVGYLDLHKVVLASTKEGPCRVYVGQGIWADVTLRYQKGAFDSFPWTFPDFAGGRYDAFLLALRENYKRQLREER
ncbi:MAG: DUF4416 family protein [Victivallales bacterium]|nr:DUF4416 family protein [Victivallales bacterium]